MNIHHHIRNFLIVAILAGIYARVRAWWKARRETNHQSPINQSPK